ncbi:hypothetical protein [Mycoplana rhizolycopersici]|uniref:Uncharacterized protein n=1 Tax=Mycoplana rhizolycopersici TaxID=2746702 RepID=A0ABX2QGU9_9HYPH|nr:hypothetical protein [Rhizobium rhizolycopersici]NVP55848.1 hypothetical protein [Rhizobium rhizolycopersici]
MEYVVEATSYRKAHTAAARHPVLLLRHLARVGNSENKNGAPGSGAPFLFSHEILVSCAPEKIDQGKKACKCDDHAACEAPAGLLSGTFHDFPKRKTIVAGKNIRPRRPSLVKK